jgi:hypothetical protein
LHPHLAPCSAHRRRRHTTWHGNPALALTPLLTAHSRANTYALRALAQHLAARTAVVATLPGTPAQLSPSLRSSQLVPPPLPPVPKAQLTHALSTSPPLIALRCTPPAPSLDVAHATAQLAPALDTAPLSPPSPLGLGRPACTPARHLAACATTVASWRTDHAHTRHCAAHANSRCPQLATHGSHHSRRRLALSPSSRSRQR